MAQRGKLIFVIAAAALTVHLLTGWRYGFHRDELATLDDARHLAWGYVAYPPVTPFFAWVSLKLFGTSLNGFRFFAALADSIGIILTGLMARQLGGNSGTQALAATAAVPFALGAGTLMQYVSFDYLAWVACSYFFVRLRKSNDPRWWLAIGGCIGLGMLNKYSILVCVVGILFAVLTTDLRRQLHSKWLWLGVALSLVLFLPNFVWQVRHDFISLDFLRYIHERDVRIGRTANFLLDQINLTLLTLPIAVLGLAFYFGSRRGERFRALGYLYLIPLLAFLLAKARGYYLAPAYPILYAGGAVFLEKLIADAPTVWKAPLQSVAWVSVLLTIAVAAAYFVPIAPVDSRWARRVFTINDDFREQIGWPELVQSVAGIRDSLALSDRSRLAVLAGNYGEAGAINFYGPDYGLPAAISGTNSFWARGYGDQPPETVILIGFSREFGERLFESCELAGKISNPYNVRNEETTDHPDIFVCRHLRQSWPQFWKNFRRYG
jgi:4-amino-4-deoxy-L-arabinose transferase-like glycosyltransferase